jgi:hypothetical protein
LTKKYAVVPEISLREVYPGGPKNLDLFVTRPKLAKTPRNYARMIINIGRRVHAQSFVGKSIESGELGDPNINLTIIKACLPYLIEITQ